MATQVGDRCLVVWLYGPGCAAATGVGRLAQPLQIIIRGLGLHLEGELCGILSRNCILLLLLLLLLMMMMMMMILFHAL